MDSTRMPLEVRVNDEKITEIYRAQDFFGDPAQETAGERARDDDVWKEMREQLSRRGGMRSGMGTIAKRLVGILAAIGGFVLLAAKAVN